jgi:hypothetical protein
MQVAEAAEHERRVAVERIARDGRDESIVVADVLARAAAVG